MKTAIIYVSKTGTTRKCAEKLLEAFKEVTLIDLSTQSCENLNTYDRIIIGSPIRIGMFDKKIKLFITTNTEVLITKKVAYFICCGFSENIKQYFETNIPKELLDSAVLYDSFGGELDITKQKGFDKFIVHMVTKNTDPNKKVEILQDRINHFIQVVTNS